jgi:hypothetical protein
LLLVSPTPAPEPTPPLGPDLSASLTPAYLYQYGARNVEETVAVARERGYDVNLVTWHVPARHDRRPVVSIEHAGQTVESLPDGGAKGPLLIVVGLTLGDQSSAAN